MDNLIDNHFNKLLCGDIRGAFSDYSKKIVCIAHVNGKSETLTGKSAAHLLWNLAKVLSLGSKHIISCLTCSPTCPKEGWRKKACAL